MKRHALTLILLFAAIRGPAAHGEPLRRGMVATVQPVATQAGLDALKAGGNAVDAAIACALTLGVVDGHNSGIGGGLPPPRSRWNGRPALWCFRPAIRERLEIACVDC